MRSPLKPSNSPVTQDFHSKETRVRTPSIKKSFGEEGIEDFLSSNGFENYINYFQENQLTFADLPYLTKEDLNDMKMPIGPRNRLIKLIENMDIKDEVRSNNEPSKRENANHYETSPMRSDLRDEVDKFMSELSQFSKRSEQQIRPPSIEPSSESFDSELNSQRIFDNVLLLLKDISDKQNFMMKAIEENQKAITTLRQQYTNSKKIRCRCSNYQ
jgi:hypothetical protein